MISYILLLPVELKHLIVELSSDDSLAALARTHSTFQRVAEKALYDTISIYASSNDSLRCVETLAQNSEKAAFVRFLTIEYTYNEYINLNRIATTNLLKSLINMHSLSDFRIRSRSSSKAEIQMMEGLAKIVCQGHFQLQTLYCHDVLDISQIIKSQTELQSLGLYTHDGQKNVLKILKELHNAQLSLPIVFLSDFTYPYHIAIFPAFYSVDRRATISQVLNQFYNNFHSKGQGGYADTVTILSIYLIDSSDLPSIYALAKHMAGSFPRIDCLNLQFERRCEIPLQEIKKEFSFFSNLHVVHTFVWTDLA